MKKLLLTTTFLLFTSSISAQEITTCTVVDPVVTVRCAGELYSIRQLSPDPDFDRELKRQWRLVAPMRDGIPHVDAPLVEVPVKAGQQVKAIITEDRFQPIGTCEVRWYQAIKKQRKDREGERISIPAMPDDCQPWYGKKP